MENNKVIYLRYDIDFETGRVITPYKVTLPNGKVLTNHWYITIRNKVVQAYPDYMFIDGQTGEILYNPNGGF